MVDETGDAFNNCVFSFQFADASFLFSDTGHPNHACIIWGLYGDWDVTVPSAVQLTRNQQYTGYCFSHRTSFSVIIDSRDGC